jgi:hypothetical protein
LILGQIGALASLSEPSRRGHVPCPGNVVFAAAQKDL